MEALEAMRQHRAVDFGERFRVQLDQLWGICDLELFRQNASGVRAVPGDGKSIYWEIV